MNILLQNKIAREKNKVEKFIDSMRDIFSNTSDESEKKNRFDVFDGFLLLATYAPPEMLEHEFQTTIPGNESVDAITYMCQKIREINGFCNDTFSDEHEIYQDLFLEIKYPTPAKKQAVRDLLSKSISETIFEKTQTYPQTMNMSLK